MNAECPIVPETLWGKIKCFLMVIWNALDIDFGKYTYKGDSLWFDDDQEWFSESFLSSSSLDEEWMSSSISDDILTDPVYSHIPGNIFYDDHWMDHSLSLPDYICDPSYSYMPVNIFNDDY